MEAGEKERANEKKTDKRTETGSVPESQKTSLYGERMRDTE